MAGLLMRSSCEDAGRAPALHFGGRRELDNDGSPHGFSRRTIAQMARDLQAMEITLAAAT
jgi:hypothetical protein